MIRRLPVYLLLDVSESMRGEPILAVNQGVRMLADALKTNPYALETAHLCLITFNNVVEEVVPLTEVYKFQPIEFEAKAGTYFGKALRYLSAKAEKVVVKTTDETKGDWKPLVFIMTDGKSGDKIEKAIKDFNRSQFGNIIICATGKQPNIKALRLISENVMLMENVNKEQILSFFKWVTASVSTCSQIIEELGVELKSINELPPPPPEVNIVV